jgi:oxygen-dependent protoporphyrinogen oxidase
VRRVVIVGGGIGGLTTALHLQDRGAEVDGGVDVIVLEASSLPGGNIQTDRVEGFTIERGPNGYLDNVPTTPALVRRLGIEDQVQRSDEAAANRYLFRDGRLHLLPSGPLGFIKSPVLSVPGRLRVFGEPFARPKPRGLDETIFDFAARRIGTEAASVLIDAMVSGVFAGNVKDLSLAASFPKMAEMEEEHGGLVKAMLARMREKRAAKKEVTERRARGEDVGELVQPGGPAGPGGTLTSFKEGLDTLPKAVAGELGAVLRYGQQVVSVETAGSAGSGGGERWIVRTASGDTLSADAAIVAVPSPQAAPILASSDEGLSKTISEIKTAGLAVVAVALDASEMGGEPQGFGFLVPRGTGPRILGCLWDSSVFPGRAPEGRVLLRAMIGGAHDPGAVDLPDEDLVRVVRKDLSLTMALEADPLFTRVYRWPMGIGQYTVGHLERIEKIHSSLASLPGLWLAGSSFYGISMNACIEKAGAQAEEVIDYLGR